MQEIEHASPSSEVFNILLAEISPKSEDLQYLLRKRSVYFIDQGFWGDVTDVERMNLHYIPTHRVANEQGQLEPFKGRKKRLVSPTFIENPNSSMPFVHERLPDLIEKSGSRRSGFSIKDDYLDKLLREGLAYNPTIATKQDLWRLTYWVHNAIPYAKVKGEDLHGLVKSSIFAPLGVVLRKNLAVCAEITAVELAILKLRGINAKSVSALRNTRLNDGSNSFERYLKPIMRHSFLEVSLPGHEEPYYSDPTGCMMGTKAEILYRHKVLGLPQNYFNDYQSQGTRCFWLNS